MKVKVTAAQLGLLNQLAARPHLSLWIVGTQIASVTVHDPNKDADCWVEIRDFRAALRLQLIRKINEYQAPSIGRLQCRYEQYALTDLGNKVQRGLA